MRKTTNPGSKKTNLKRLVKDGKTSIVEVMHEGAVRTQVHEIQDPSERLISIIGAAMFNEPKYYPTDPLERGHKYNKEDIDEHAQLIINTAMEIAESDHPKDLLSIAHWARKEMRIRTTPQVLLAVAAHCAGTKEHVRQYAPKIIQRADELKDVFTASRALFGAEKSLPNSLKRGLADAFAKFGEGDYLKYEGQSRPYFSDILKMVDRAKNYPLPKELDHYLKTNEVMDAAKTPIIAARKALTKMEKFDAKAKKLAKESQATWEVLLSQFGNSKEVWEYLIDSDQLGYMATMRNLRNFLQAGISTSHIQKVVKKLVDGALYSKQLPYRFLAAKKAVLGNDNQSYHPAWGMSGDHSWYSMRAPKDESEKAIVEALNDALDAVVGALPKLPGASLLAIDDSGSMSAKVSGKSDMSCNEAAAVLAGIVYKCSTPESVAGGFGDRWVPGTMPNTEKVLNIAQHLAQLPTGHSTNAEDILAWALKSKKKFDRIIIMSDMQTYGGNGGWGYGYGHSRKSIKELIAQYRKEVNPECKLHCIDLAGHGMSLTEQADTKTNLVAGFSEKLMDTIMAFEGLTPPKDGDEDQGEEAPNAQKFTLEMIREKF